VAGITIVVHHDLRGHRKCSSVVAASSTKQCSCLDRFIAPSAVGAREAVHIVRHTKRPPQEKLSPVEQSAGFFGDLDRKVGLRIFGDKECEEGDDVQTGDLAKL